MTPENENETTVAQLLKELLEQRIEIIRELERHWLELLEKDRLELLEKDREKE